MPLMHAPDPKQLQRAANPIAEAAASPHAVQLKQSLRGLGFAEQEAALRPTEGAPVQRRESNEATTGLKANAKAGELINIRQLAAAYAGGEQRAMTMYETLDQSVRTALHKIAGFKSTYDSLTSKGELWEKSPQMARDFQAWVAKLAT